LDYSAEPRIWIQEKITVTAHGGVKGLIDCAHRKLTQSQSVCINPRILLLTMGVVQYEKLKAESLPRFPCDVEVRGAHASKKINGHSCRKVTLIMSSLTLIAGSIVILTLVVLRRWNFTNPDIFKFQMSGSNGKTDVMQHVHSSVSGNYVQYNIEVSDNDETTILDDFNTELEVIKSKRNGHSICFVSRFNRSQAMLPSDDLPAIIPYKKTNSGVYQPEDEPTTDRSFLGKMSQELCEDANVFWMHPMEETNKEDLDIPGEQPPAEGEEGPHHRSKRNIRQCHTSCCWLVCCCDTHHFTWETYESFTCKHVCNKCTSQYKSKIQKLC